MFKHTIFGAAIAVIATGCAPTADQAGGGTDCTTPRAGDELSFAEANAVYECIAGALHAGYKQGEKRWVNADHVASYRGWTRAATGPANPQMHGDRFLLTYVNDIGAAMYLQYADNPTVPVGTVLAKESFSVDGAGKVEKGPLFLMEKAPAGSSPKTDDWYYSMVSPKGTPVAVNVFKACSECHQGNFGEQGGMGYPVEEVRIQN